MFSTQMDFLIQTENIITLESHGVRESILAFQTFGLSQTPAGKIKLWDRKRLRDIQVKEDEVMVGGDMVISLEIPTYAAFQRRTKHLIAAGLSTRLFTVGGR